MVCIKDRTEKKEINAKDIKQALCDYFYLKRHCIYFCKEHYLHRYDMRADFIALLNWWVDGKFLNRAIEIEVKITWSDFIRDFKDKELKHKEYCGEIGQTPLVNYFAFCVPVSMYDRCKEFLDANYPKYGLFIYDAGVVIQGRGSMFSDKKLLTTTPTPITKDEIAKQMAIHIVYKN